MRAVACLPSSSTVALVRRAVVLAFALCVGGSTAAVAVPGELDPAFGRDGSVVTRFRNSYTVATDLALQPDGRLVVVGPVHTDASILSDFGIVRYMPDGKRDTTFSKNGKRRVDLDGRYDQATAVALQPDGRIVVVGTSGGDATILRLMPDGSIDRSFSDDGHRSFDPGAFATVGDVAIDDAGRIVIVGSDGPDIAVARVLPGGALDDGFGDGGIVHTDVAGYGDAATAVAMDPGGLIVVGGWATVSPAQRTDFAVVRYLEGGTPDPGFGAGGIVTTDFDAWEDSITELALDASGSIVVAGQASVEPGGADQSSDVGLARYLSDGSPDPSFGDGGATTTDFGSYFDQTHGLALQADGKIVVSSHRYADGLRTAAVARFDTGGALDGTFGDAGIADTGRSVSGDEVGGISIRPDGGIVAATAATLSATTGSTFAFLVMQVRAE